MSYDLTETEVTAILIVAYGEGDHWNEDLRLAWRSAYRKLAGRELDW